MKRRGFTLLELLVSIGILVILGTILIMGTRQLIGSGKGSSATVSVNAARGMYDELATRSQGAPKSPPSSWVWSDVTGNIVAPAGDVDFWRVPFRDTTLPLRNPDALDAPGAMTAAVNLGSSAVMNTQLAMGKLLAMPANKSAMDKMQQTLVPEWQSGEFQSLWSDGTIHTTPITYLVGMRVRFGGKRYYCKQNHQDPAGASNPEINTAAWDEDVPSPTAALGAGSQPPLILLDDWGNPIIYVPGTGLRTRLMGSKTSYDGSVEQVQIVTSGGHVARNAGNLPYVTAAGQPFFASAGADGDFSKGDDNIYSFGK